MSNASAVTFFRYRFFADASPARKQSLLNDTGFMCLTF
ncbi:hypothetical protein PMI16_01574 [Herbaspirillum sp. CF444]|nr:hypothetical protein PMI16_01574 [Herbaspirillum sp. CF444]